MTTVMAAVIAFSGASLATKFPDANADHFANMTLFLMAGIMLLASILRLGKYITLIPNVVISGFMDGIAIIIWLDQVKLLFGVGGKTALHGDFLANLLVFFSSVALAFIIPMIAKKYFSKFASLISGTFFTIVIVTTIAAILHLDIQRVSLATGLRSWSDFTSLVSSQIPTDWSWALVLTALPFALQLAILGYLDTLMTALVIDKLTGETTKPNKELFGQGVAHVAVAFVGGIAGAQATIRSVLMVREGAAWRWAGVLVGIFALIEMMIFQDWIKLIPQAVFAGVLVKVGCDVFDWLPLQIYSKQLFRHNDSKQSGDSPVVHSMEVIFVLGTAIVTVFFDLNIAVGVFTALFYIHNCVLNRARPMQDLRLDSESQGFSDED
jgi:SulP family sulfate permease